MPIKSMRNSKKSLNTVCALLAAVTLLGAGCNIHRSGFLSKFSLDGSVKDVGYKGIVTGRGPGGVGGSIGGSTGGIGPGGGDVRSSVSSATSFLINEEGENRFVESEFLEGLGSQIRKQIEESHGNVIASGSAAPNEFYVDYKEGDLKGRITISGSARGQSYVLKSNIEESNKR